MIPRSKVSVLLLSILIAHIHPLVHTAEPLLAMTFCCARLFA